MCQLVSSLYNVRIFGKSVMADVVCPCVGGCVAKAVGVEEEKLKFFNTASILDKDVLIYEVSSVSSVI